MPSWLIAVLSVVGGGIAGSVLSFMLALRREQRRTRDAYRSPQRAAIAAIVAAVNDLMLRTQEFSTFIENSAAQSEAMKGLRPPIGVRSHYSDAEADLISSQVNRAVVGIDEAFSIGKLTIVEGRCYEAMVTAYKEFAMIQSAFVNLEAMPRTSAALRTAIHPFVERVVQLKKDLRDLVDAGQRHLAPTQSLGQERDLNAAKARLRTKYPDLK